MFYFVESGSFELRHDGSNVHGATFHSGANKFDMASETQLRRKRQEQFLQSLVHGSPQAWLEEVPEVSARSLSRCKITDVSSSGKDRRRHGEFKHQCLVSTMQRAGIS